MRTLKSLQQMTMYEFRYLMRNKIAFFFNLILPVVLVGIFGSMYGNMDTEYNSPIGWVDRDQGPVAERLRQTMDATKRYTISTGDEAELKAQLSKGKLRAILVLPQDLSEQVAAGATPSVQVLRDPSSNSSNVDAAALMNLIARVGAEMTGTRPQLVPVLQDLPGMDHFSLFDFIMPGQLVYMLLAAGLMSTAIGLAYQRQNGSLRHLFTTPLSMGVWVGAQMLSKILLAGLQIVVLFTAARFMFGVSMPLNIAGTLVTLVVCALASLAMGLAIGALVRSPEAAFPVSMIAFFLMAMFGNAMMPIDGAPELMLQFQKLMPSLYMTHSLRQVMMKGEGLGAVLADFSVLLSCMVVFGGLAIWRIRKQVTAA